MNTDPRTADVVVGIQAPIPWPEEPIRLNAGRFAEQIWGYKDHVGSYDYVGRKYEMDMSIAALQRLRIAVEALKGCSGGWGGLADKALAQIGEIP